MHCFKDCCHVFDVSNAFDVVNASCVFNVLNVVNVFNVFNVSNVFNNCPMNSCYIVSFYNSCDNYPSMNSFIIASFDEQF